jgi:hypothetical protein
MIRFICGGLAVALWASPLVAAPRHDDSANLPMRFSLHREGPSESCGTKCRVLISASEMISADTPRDFDVFVRGRDVRGATIVLDSKGGSVLGAIMLGRSIRALGLTTTVGRVKDAGRRDGKAIATLSPNGDCQSMCPFVLLGGTSRFVPPESRVLVHQIWLGDRRDDATAAQYSAEDLVLVQRDIGRLMQYTAEMGASTELLELALRIPPWEPMRELSREELRRARLDSSTTHWNSASSTPVASTVAMTASSAVTADIDERGWLLSERSGQAVLTRQHPLTIEGERIGTFEMALGCGPGAAYTLTYSEWRQVPTGATAKLKRVDLWIRDVPASLPIETSRVRNAGEELETVAKAAVPADLVRLFADAASDSLTVQTESPVVPATSIRVGNSGFTPNFRRLAAACGDRRQLQKDARVTADQPRANAGSNSGR